MSNQELEDQIDQKELAPGVKKEGGELKIKNTIIPFESK